jgi:hypothetical protein
MRDLGTLVGIADVYEAVGPSFTVFGERYVEFLAAIVPLFSAYGGAIDQQLPALSSGP